MINKIKNINIETISRWVIILLPFMLIYFYIYLSDSPELKKVNTENEKLQKKIDKLNQNNDEIFKRFKELDQKQSAFFDLMNKNNDLIEKNNKELDKLKKMYNEKITDANNYNVKQLDSFFRKRYKIYY